MSSQDQKTPQLPDETISDDALQENQQVADQALIAWMNRSPFVGFWPRFFTLLIDWGFIYFLMLFLSWGVRNILLYFNPFLPIVGWLLGFIYFWVMMGPLCGGRTVGMLIMQTRIVDAKGEPISNYAAAKRAFIKMLGFLFIIGPVTSWLIMFPAGWDLSAWFLFQVIGSLATSLMIIQAFCVSVQPMKRSFHDLWADTYVTRNPIPGNFVTTIELGLDPISERKSQYLPKVMLVFFVVLSGILIVPPFLQPGISEENTIRRAQALVRKQHPLSPYTILTVTWPQEELLKYADQQINFIRSNYEMKKLVAPTTDTIHSTIIPYDRETVFIRAFRLNGPVSDQDLENPHLLEAIDGLRRELRKQRYNDQASSLTQQTRRFSIQLTEPCNILFRMKDIPYANISGSLDDLASPLSIKKIEPFPNIPMPADTVSTTTAVTTGTFQVTLTTDTSNATSKTLTSP